MEKDRRSPKDSEDLEIDIQACSTMDCTGLIPSLPQNEGELESYEALYSFEPPVVDEKEKEERSC
jgi:hypothetical protein